MSPEKQRIAIAEACGWQHTNDERIWTDTSIQRAGRFWHFIEHLPDYLNDLNSMHKAENSFALDGKWLNYEKELTRLTPMGRCVWHATAAQRAEAFLKTVGRWEDNKIVEKPLKDLSNCCCDFTAHCPVHGSAKIPFDVKYD